VKLVQHKSQLSVLLIAMKKLGDKANRIGYRLLEGLKKNENNED